MSNELEIKDPEGMRNPQLASIVPREKWLIGLLVTVLGGTTGLGGGYAGTTAAQAEQAAKIEKNTEKIEDVSESTTAAVGNSEKRVMAAVQEVKDALYKHVANQENVNRELLRALGRLEGEIKSFKR